MTDSSTHAHSNESAHNHTNGRGHSHGHSHGNPADLREVNRRSLLGVVALTGGFMLVELVVGLVTNSLAILADAGHMLGDVAGVGLALIANWFASRPASEGKTYGYYRTEILASTANALAILLMSIFIISEALTRFVKPDTDLPAIPMILIGITGSIINVICIKILGSQAKESLNTKAAYLEILSDLLASAGVVFAGIVIWLTGFRLIDPIVSLVIAAALIPRTWWLLSQCVHILMEGTPDHITMNELRDAITAVPGVVEVHDLHVWTITSGMDAMSGHVIVDQAADSAATLHAIGDMCEKQFGITHSTIQIELISCDRNQCD